MWRSRANENNHYYLALRSDGKITDTTFASGKVAVGGTNASAVFDDVVVSLP